MSDGPFIMVDTNERMIELQNQQQLIIRLLSNEEIKTPVKVINFEQWKSIMLGTGIDANQMKSWHIRFEIESPDMHQSFLEMLGLPAKDIKKIRIMSGKL